MTTAEFYPQHGILYNVYIYIKGVSGNILVVPEKNIIAIGEARRFDRWISSSRMSWCQLPIHLAAPRRDPIHPDQHESSVHELFFVPYVFYIYIHIFMYIYIYVYIYYMIYIVYTS